MTLRQLQALSIQILILAVLTTVLEDAVSAGWLDQLPVPAQSSILWSATHESGDMSDWTMPQFQYAGGGIFNTGDDDVSAVASQTVAHSGSWAASTTITNAIQAQNGNRAVRLMRWTDRAWDDGGQYFPDSAYYSTWAYFPHTYNPNKYAPWDPGDGGWWNIFQFKGEDADEISQPLWTMNVEHNDDTNEMSVYLYSKYNTPKSYGQAAPLAIPKGEWVHFEAFYESATGNHGQIKIWQDGNLILQAKDVVTSLGGAGGNDTHVIWGIGNYTDHIDGDPAGVGQATIYFDDSAVSAKRLSRFQQVIGNVEPGSDPMFVPEPIGLCALGLCAPFLAAYEKRRRATHSAGHSLAT